MRNHETTEATIFETEAHFLFRMEQEAASVVVTVFENQFWKEVENANLIFRLLAP